VRSRTDRWQSHSDCARIWEITYLPVTLVVLLESLAAGVDLTSVGARFGYAKIRANSNSSAIRQRARNSGYSDGNLLTSGMHTKPRVIIVPSDESAAVEGDGGCEWVTVVVVVVVVVTGGLRWR
jgi:hypothetical protein